VDAAIPVTRSAGVIPAPARVAYCRSWVEAGGELPAEDDLARAGRFPAGDQPVGRQLGGGPAVTLDERKSQGMPAAQHCDRE
jgi:hypothetical protein